MRIALVVVLAWLGLRAKPLLLAAGRPRDLLDLELLDKHG